MRSKAVTSELFRPIPERDYNRDYPRDNSELPDWSHTYEEAFADGVRMMALVGGGRFRIEKVVNVEMVEAFD